MPTTAISKVEAQARLDTWFDAQGWTPFQYQRTMWEAYAEGASGLLHADTGTGKTLAAWGGPVVEGLAQGDGPDGLRVLWITPLRALAADTVRALQAAAHGVGLAWRVESRTGDTSAYLRQKQRVALPAALVTTPESLTLLLSYPEARRVLRTVRAVVVDEWHELMGSKRGVQTELALARLRRWVPDIRTWGVSATIGNLDEAAAVLLGPGDAAGAMVVHGTEPKPVDIDTLVPPTMERFPWAGHLGLRLLPEVADEVRTAESALLFTNTRSFAERWYRSLLKSDPRHFAGRIGLHHGSLDRDQREFVEHALGDGRLQAVVATSSLDLGIDLAPVERVFQIGSPKGVGRLLQRAGRSGHQPGARSRITGVPTHALELLEFAATRRAGARGTIEARVPPPLPLDVLVQHVVTAALAEPFTADELRSEVRTTFSFANLSDEDWAWVLDFCASGDGLGRPDDEVHRIALDEGRYHVTTDTVARRHRMSIGTITSDQAVAVKYRNGSRLGTVEESFAARLRPGDTFMFAGRALEAVRLKDLTLTVRKAATDRGATPRWSGGRLPLSSTLSAEIRDLLDAIDRGESVEDPEVDALTPILALQREWSEIPAGHHLVVERLATGEGHHLFVYPLAGRQVHEGLAAVWAVRLSRVRPATYTLSYNDYGFEMLSAEPAPVERALAEDLLDADGVLDDLTEGVNVSELARRQFREVARVAGLVFTGYPGREKRLAQIQASAGLLFDVYERHAPGHPLVEQARRETLRVNIDPVGVAATAERMARLPVRVVDVPRLTPFAAPLYIDRLRARVSGETMSKRMERMLAALERDAERALGGTST